MELGIWLVERVTDSSVTSIQFEVYNLQAPQAKIFNTFMQCAMCVLYTYNVQCMHNARKDHVLPMRLKWLTLLYALTPMGTNALEMQVQLGWSLKINLFEGTASRL